MNLKKVLKIIGIILLVIVVFFVIHTTRNYIIITGLQNKIAKYSNSTNYYTKIASTESNGTVVTTRYYKKGNKEGVFLERNFNGDISKMSMYKNGENINIYWDDKGNKTAKLDSDSMISVQIYNFTETDTNLQKILGSITARIKTTNYNGKECYVIKGFLTSTVLTVEGTEVYIEKDTGLFVKAIEGDTITEREYDFNNVDDKIFIEPDISEYKLQENN